MTAEERREKEFEQAAKGYLWGDYVNAGTEFEEVEAFVKLLNKTWEAGRNAGIEDAAQVADLTMSDQFEDAASFRERISAAIRALGKQEK